MRNWVLPVFLCALGHALNAQSPAQLTQENGDCMGAIVIADSVHRQPHAVRGFGNKLEIKENPREDLQWFEREHHTTWYKFRSPATTTLTFEIIPDNVEDDIDFLLFQGAVPGICEKISTKQAQPVRSNISRNDKSNGSICGLRKGAMEDFVRSGVGSSFSRPMEVQQGELFYLVVDYQDRPLAGYTIRFHYDPPPIPETAAEEQQELRQRVQIDVFDAVTGSPLTADLTIDGMQFDKVVQARGGSSYSYEMDMYRSLKIGCIRAGYMFQTLRVKGSMEPLLKVEVRMEPIRPGARVVLEDIRFVGNEVNVMRQSEASLKMLLHFMEANPGVRIEVEGHVNGPTFKNTKEFIQLSTARARTVYEFLLVNDIPPERLSYVGMGNSQMLFPQPRNKEQSEANRRVEIKVLGM